MGEGRLQSPSFFCYLSYAWGYGGEGKRCVETPVVVSWKTNLGPVMSSLGGRETIE